MTEDISKDVEGTPAKDKPTHHWPDDVDEGEELVGAVPVSVLAELVELWQRDSDEFTKMNPVGKAYRTCAQDLEQIIDKYDR